MQLNTLFDSVILQTTMNVNRLLWYIPLWFINGCELMGLEVRGQRGTLWFTFYFVNNWNYCVKFQWIFHVSFIFKRWNADYVMKYLTMLVAKNMKYSNYVSFNIKHFIYYSISKVFFLFNWNQVPRCSMNY